MLTDRAFGRVEKILRTHEIILLPDEYYDCFNEVGNVRKFGIDWFVYDYKKLADKVLKKQPGFKITETKILEVFPTPGQLTVKNFYVFSGCRHSLVKRGKSWRGHQLRKAPETNYMKTEKKRDVMRLLEAIGQDQNVQVMDFYKNICVVNENVAEVDSEEGEDKSIANFNEDEW